MTTVSADTPPTLRERIARARDVAVTLADELDSVAGALVAPETADTPIPRGGAALMLRGRLDTLTSAPAATPLAEEARQRIARELLALEALSYAFARALDEGAGR
jgi:hypothetical protein